MTTSNRSFDKDPSAVLDYTFDWSGPKPGPWLPAGDTISTHTITADTGITVNSSSITSPTTVTVWLSGGTVGENYDVVCRVTTAGGRTDDRTITITVRQR